MTVTDTPSQLNLENHKIYKMLLFFSEFMHSFSKYLQCLPLKKTEKLCKFKFEMEGVSSYIMQSSLPTTIYVQNLSFLVTQISTSRNFFLFDRFT